MIITKRTETSADGIKIFDIELPNHYDKIRVNVFSDIHIGDPLCDVEYLQQRINRVKQIDNAVVILNGDLINNAIKSSVSDVYSDTLTPHQQVNEVVRLFEPIKDKILFACDGNHETRTYKETGISPTEIIADKLGIPFTETTWYLFLAFGKNNGRDTRNTVYSFYGAHGSGGGSTIGSKMNRLTKLGNYSDADCIIHSHTHVPATFKEDTFRVDYRKRGITQITRTFVNTNAFLKFGGYGAVKGFSPSSRVQPEIILDGTKRDIKVII